MRASPDTADVFDYVLSYDHYGGYHFSDRHIQCFSHTHAVGSGASDWGNIGVMAVMGVTKETIVSSGYWSEFSHAQEIASPGYYSVFLQTPRLPLPNPNLCPAF